MAAACDRMVLIHPRSIPTLTGPAPSLALSFPNWMSHPRSSSRIRSRRNLCSRMVRLTPLERPMRLLTPCRSSRRNLIKSPNVFASREPRAIAGSPRSMRRSTSSAHSSASFRRKNVSLTYFPFRRTWARHDPELSLENVAKTCALRVHEPLNCRAKGRIMA